MLLCYVRTAAYFAYTLLLLWAPAQNMLRPKLCQIKTITIYCYVPGQLAEVDISCLRRNRFVSCPTCAAAEIDSKRLVCTRLVRCTKLRSMCATWYLQLAVAARSQISTKMYFQTRRLSAVSKKCDHSTYGIIHIPSSEFAKALLWLAGQVAEWYFPHLLSRFTSIMMVDHDEDAQENTVTANNNTPSSSVPSTPRRLVSVSACLASLCALSVLLESTTPVPSNAQMLKRILYGWFLRTLYDKRKTKKFF